MQFKKNAGKYVGSFNFRSLRFATRTADLVVLLGLGLNLESAIEIMGYMDQVLSVNSAAGERGIPDSVHAKASLPKNSKEGIRAELTGILNAVAKSYVADVKSIEALCESEICETSEND